MKLKPKSEFCFLRAGSTKEPNVNRWEYFSGQWFS